jgi:hypothetical protein
VYPSSMCRTIARVHSWAQGDSPKAPVVRSGAFGDEQLSVSRQSVGPTLVAF